MGTGMGMTMCAVCHNLLAKSRYNNGLIVKLVSIFVDVDERGEEREESLALMQAINWTQNHMYMWAQTKVYMRRNRKEKVRHDTI
jgi:hypothetical protein